MSHLPADWPIAAGLLQFPAVDRQGRKAQDADPEQWFDAFLDLSQVGFDKAELADTWVRAADMSSDRLDDLVDAARQAGIEIPSVALIRSSIIDPENGAENLAYSHRALEAAAHMGSSVVSFGLHRPLTPEQRDQFWFWTAQGPRDEPDDVESWNRAVAGFRELGAHAESLGLQISLEMYEDTFLGSADSAVRLITEIGMDNVGLNPDIGNLIRLHRPVESWEELVVKTAPYANYWHIKNYFRDEDTSTGTFMATPAPLELGAVNYRWAIREMVRAGFQGIFVCEHYGGDGIGVAARNRDYIRSVLPDASARPAFTSRNA